MSERNEVICPICNERAYGICECGMMEWTTRIRELEAGLRHCIDNMSIECEIDSVMIERLLAGDKL